MKDLNVTSIPRKPSKVSYKRFIAKAKKTCGTCTYLNIAGTFCWKTSEKKSSATKACPLWYLMGRTYFETTYCEGGRSY